MQVHKGEVITALILVLTGSITLVRSDLISPTILQDEQLREIFLNFTFEVVDALADFEEAPTDRMYLSNYPASASSLYGYGFVLTMANENLWPTATPGFEKLLKSARNLPDAYALLLLLLGRDNEIKITNTVFTPDNLSPTDALTKMKAQVVQLDFTSPDAASKVNSYISQKIERATLDSYIPSKAMVPQSTRGIIVNTVHFVGNWPSPLMKVNSTKFNGVDPIDLYEIKGQFQYQVSEKTVQVTIPFKSGLRSLVLILPNDMSDAFRGDYGDSRNGTAQSVRVQFPLFNFTLRTPHEPGPNSAVCAFKKADNFFHMLDDVIYVSLGQDNFETVSITGALIHNVAEFKKEVVAAPDSPEIPKTVTGAQHTILPTGRSDNPDDTEKVIVLDRSFQWRIDALGMGPIFFGTIESLANSNWKAYEEAPSVFGRDKHLPYINCL